MPENEKMDDYTPDIITLEDEEGNEFSFEVIDAADYNDTRYLAVVPYKDAAAEQLEEDANLILMRVGEENGEGISRRRRGRQRGLRGGRDVRAAPVRAVRH